MKKHFEMMSAYNAWANERLYRMAAGLTDEQYRRNVSAYFQSMHGTLNHLLVADRIWLSRLTGVGTPPASLDAILFEDLPALTAARRVEDERLIRFMQDVTETQLNEVQHYHTLTGVPQVQVLREILAHLFNHQTHHRGQAHTILTVLGIAEPEPLDLLLMQRNYR